MITVTGLGGVEAPSVDHLVLGAPDLESGMAWARDVLGVDAVEGGRHARWRTRNALIGLGPSTYLEILAQDRSLVEEGGADRYAQDDLGDRPFGLDRITRAAPVAWALRTADIRADRGTAIRHGLPMGPVLEGSRERPDGTTLRWRLTDPVAVPAGGVVPFLIDWESSIHPSTTLDHGCVLETLRLGTELLDPLRSFLTETRAAQDERVRLEKATQPRVKARIRTPAGTVDLG